MISLISEYNYFKNEFYQERSKLLFNKDSYNLQLRTIYFQVPGVFLSELLNEGVELLYVYNYPPLKDVNDPFKLGESAENNIISNIILHLQKRAMRGEIPKIKKFHFFNFRNFYDLDLKRNEHDHPYCKFFIERLQDYITTIKPQGIILGDPGLLKIIQYNMNGKAENSSEVSDYLKYLGRVINFKYSYGTESIVVPTIATVSTFDLGLADKGDNRNNGQIEEGRKDKELELSDLENKSSLLNDNYKHFEQILYLKNFYEITDKDSWKREDIFTLEEFDLFYEKLIKNKITAIDLETNNLNKFVNKILTAHFAFDSSTIYNLPLFHRETPFNPEELEYIAKKLKWFLEEGESEYLVFHNAKFDLSILTAQLQLCFINHKIYDTLAGIFALNESKKFYDLLKGEVGPYQLKTQSYYYGSQVYDEEEGLSKADRTRLNEEPLIKVLDYATKDAIITFQVYEFQLKEAERRKYKKWKEFVIEQLGAMTHCFIHMEVKGILVDKGYLLSLLDSGSELQMLFTEVQEEFKKRTACQNVNAMLLFHEVFTQNLKEHIKVFEVILTKLLKQDKKASKHMSLFAEEEALDNPVPKFKELLEAYMASCREILKDVSKSAFLLLEFVQDQVEIGNHKSAFSNLQSLIKKFSPLELNKLSEAINLQSEYWVNTLNSIFEHISNAKIFFQNFLQNLKRDNVRWAFDIAKRDSQQLLFFTELNLEMQDMRKDGGGKTNKVFQKHYAEIPEVKLFEDYNKYKKLTSTYIEGMYDRMEKSDDAKKDSRLRASYDYLYVVTGRSSCLPGDAKILTAEGLISIDHLVNLKKETLVLTHEGNWKPIVNWIKSGVREVYEIKTESGRIIKATKCHKFYIGDGKFQKLEELTKENSLFSLLNFD